VKERPPWFMKKFAACHEVAPQLVPVVGGDLRHVEGVSHVIEPGVAGLLTDREAKVPGAKHRLSPQILVLGAAAEVLRQERCQTRPGGLEALLVHRSQELVGLHPGVEAIDQRNEELSAADPLIEPLGTRVGAHRASVGGEGSHPVTSTCGDPRIVEAVRNPRKYLGDYSP
jgi:hypothetical protein